MNNERDFWDKVVDLIPKYKKMDEETKEIYKSVEKIEEIAESPLEIEEKIETIFKNKKKTVKMNMKNNKISEKSLKSEVGFDDKFLKESIKDWDKLDYLFVFFIIAVDIAIYSSKKNLYSDTGKEIHNSHNQKLKNNKYHYKMPNDKIPNNFRGINNKFNQYGGARKINDIGLNHRYIYGHDLLKPFEIFKELDSIEKINPVLGSKKLGAIIKQINHLWFDLYSESGLPAPGSTYFLDLITKHFINTNDEFIKYFSLHIEDILSAGGIELCLYFYNRYRQYDESIEIMKNLKKFQGINIKNRNFKEYEMGILVHSLSLWLELNLTIENRGKINHLHISFLMKNIIQYIRLNKKWNKEYKNSLIHSINNIINIEIPEEIKTEYKIYCEENNIKYSDKLEDVYINIKNNDNEGDI